MSGRIALIAKVFNLFDIEDINIDCSCTLWLWGKPDEGADDIHLRRTRHALAGGILFLH